MMAGGTLCSTASVRSGVEVREVPKGWPRTCEGILPMQTQIKKLEDALARLSEADEDEVDSDEYERLLAELVRLRESCVACKTGRHDHCGAQVSASGTTCKCPVCLGSRNEGDPFVSN